MLLTGTNYNIRDNTIEHQRLAGKGVYNKSRAEHFLNLYNRKPVVYKGAGLFNNRTSNTNKVDFTKLMSSAYAKPMKPMVKGGSLKRSEEQQEEINLRVKAEKPRKRIGEKPNETTLAKRNVSGRSTKGINRDRKADKKESFAIMRANTKRQMKDTQQPIKGGGYK